MRRAVERLQLLPMLLEAGFLLAATRVALRLVPLRVARTWLWDFTGAAGEAALKGRRPEVRILRAMAAAEKYSPVRCTCLAHALVGQALLKRHGYDSQLRIGVRRDEKGEFLAHAWLEREGKIVIGGPASMVQNYTALPEMEHLIA